MKVTRKNELKRRIETGAEGGNGKLYLDALLQEFNMPEKLRMFSRATLEPGASVGFHEHIGESESYYILSGRGQYDDDGKICVVSEGDVTFTPNGHGHGIKNIGDTPLEFIALIVKD